MQKLTPFIIGLAWLVAVSTHAQDPDYIIQLNQAAPLKIEASATIAAKLAGKSIEKASIALLLPLQSADFGHAANVIRSGFEAAANTDSQAHVIYIDEDASNVITRYHDTVATGVKVVVGPLIRQDIAVLAPHVSVPTLVLNTFDAHPAYNANLFTLSLAVEGEARQMAGDMLNDGRSSPLVLSSHDSLSQRIALAFINAWKTLTGEAPLQLSWPSDIYLSKSITQADSLFIAMDTQNAATLKAALPSTLVVYATSQINTRPTLPALAGIHYIDMPWFLMPQQTEVARYPRPSTTMTLSTERLYALGIDAYRIALRLAQGQTKDLQLHGVTGDLILQANQQFERILPAAVLLPEEDPTSSQTPRPSTP